MINIMIGYDDHTSTYGVEIDDAQRILEMDDTYPINDFIVTVGHYVTGAHEAQNANCFMDIAAADDLSLFLADLKEELAVTV